MFRRTRIPVGRSKGTLVERVAEVTDFKYRHKWPTIAMTLCLVAHAAAFWIMGPKVERLFSDDLVTNIILTALPFGSSFWAFIDGFLDLRTTDGNEVAGRLMWLEGIFLALLIGEIFGTLLLGAWLLFGIGVATLCWVAYRIWLTFRKLWD